MNPVRTAFKAKPIPVPGAAVDLVYHPPVIGEAPEFWTIRLYRDNLNRFDGVDQQAIAFWTMETLHRITELTPEVVSIEVFEKEPEHERR